MSFESTLTSPRLLALGDGLRSVCQDRLEVKFFLQDERRRRRWWAWRRHTTTSRKEPEVEMNYLWLKLGYNFNQIFFDSFQTTVAVSGWHEIEELSLSAKSRRAGEGCWDVEGWLSEISDKKCWRSDWRKLQFEKVYDRLNLTLQI